MDIHSDWIPPKTDWNGGESEFFELDRDYFRIRTDILCLQSILEEINLKKIPLIDMVIVKEEDIPTATFFNNLVKNVETLEKESYAKGLEFVAMRKYLDNDPVPSYRDLNSLERNILLLFNSNVGIIRFKQKVGVKRMNYFEFY